MVALSKLYGRPLVVYNEQDDSVQEQVFPSVEEDEHPTSTEELKDPVSTGDTHDLTPVHNPHHQSQLSLGRHVDAVGQTCTRIYYTVTHPAQILLAYCDGNHYDSVYTKDRKSSMASCQGERTLP